MLLITEKSKKPQTLCYLLYNYIQLLELAGHNHIGQGRVLSKCALSKMGTFIEHPNIDEWPLFPYTSFFGCNF